MVLPAERRPRVAPSGGTPMSDRCGAKPDKNFSAIVGSVYRRKLPVCPPTAMACSNDEGRPGSDDCDHVSRARPAPAVPLRASPASVRSGHGGTGEFCLREKLCVGANVGLFLGGCRRVHADEFDSLDVRARVRGLREQADAEGGTGRDDGGDAAIHQRRDLLVGRVSQLPGWLTTLNLRAFSSRTQSAWASARDISSQGVGIPANRVTAAYLMCVRSLYKVPHNVSGPLTSRPTLPGRDHLTLELESHL